MENSKVLDIVSSLTMNDFTVDELRVIHETLRMMIEQAQRRAKAKFLDRASAFRRLESPLKRVLKRGDRVSFIDRRGRRVEGVVEKICNKTVTVLAQGDTATVCWRVAPSRLSIVS